jgi:ribose/xylose/arabinose/galactoside ABC-type transport system permease subunit
MAERSRLRLAGRPVIALVLLAGIAAMLVAMAAGLAPGLLETMARPAPIVRAALAGASIVLGGRLLLSAIRRIDRSVRREVDDAGADRLSDADLGMLVRGVRLVFLAAAAFAAASGWVLGEPLPLIVALVIAGVDVVETSFLLLVATGRDMDS